MRPQRGPLSPALRRWAEAAAPGERRDVLVLLVRGRDPTAAADRLAELGAHIQRAGQASVVVAATGPVVLAVADEPWVLAVSEPHPLQPR